MRKLIILVSILVFSIGLFSQTSKDGNLICSIKWDENIVEKKSYISTALSITSYCFIDENTIALLNAEEQKIIIYSLATKKIEKNIQLPYGAMDFDYNDGKFYVLDFDKLYIINCEGQVDGEIKYKRPVGRQFALEKFRVIDGKNIINVSSM